MVDETKRMSGVDIKLFYTRREEPARVAVFLSGTGSNAEVLLDYAAGGDRGFVVSQLVTDAPESSAARRLGRGYGVPVVELDIRRFYRERGEESIRLDSELRRQIRGEWSAALWELVREGKPDFGVLAGFVPLTNIAAWLNCLNVHPGDLSLVGPDGGRLLAGLHFRPVERALLSGHRTLRSSVILAQGYSGSGEQEMDSGPLLGVSSEVPVELDGITVEELRRIAGERGHAPFHDRLRELAQKNLERLKRAGDHIVLPRVVEAYAKGCYGFGEDGLYFRGGAGEWEPVRTVEFSVDGVKPIAR